MKEENWGSNSIQLFAISCFLSFPFVFLMIEAIRDPKAAQGASTIGGCFFCSGVLVNLLGAGCGLAGLYQPDRKNQRLAVWGLTLNMIFPIIMYLFALALPTPNP